MSGSASPQSIRQNAKGDRHHQRPIAQSMIDMNARSAATKQHRAVIDV
jgi:hypothetical protein